MSLTGSSLFIHRDGWEDLKALTPARIALGRTGVSIPADQNLKFRMAHALARDAVYSSLDFSLLHREMETMGFPIYDLNTQAFHRQDYLQRPDLGRKLSEQSRDLLRSLQPASCDVAFSIADGLSAQAVNQHAVPLLKELFSILNHTRVTIGPLTLIEHGRVAVSDEVGELLMAKLVVVLIGERPGLTVSQSLGAYLTFAPKTGNTDEVRNCVSNIHQNGMSYRDAASTISFLVTESLRLGFSGVHLKGPTHRHLIS